MGSLSFPIFDEGIGGVFVTLGLLDRSDASKISATRPGGARLGLGWVAEFVENFDQAGGLAAARR